MPFYIPNFQFPKKLEQKTNTCSPTTITGPPPTSQAPLKRDHQHCHQPSTTATRSTPQPASQLPKKKKKNTNTSSPVTTNKQSIKNLLDTQPQIGTSQCVDRTLITTINQSAHRN